MTSVDGGDFFAALAQWLRASGCRPEGTGSIPVGGVYATQMDR